MSKKLFFYSNHREDDESIGITKKVHSQITELKNRGYKVYYSAYYKKGIAIFGDNNELIAYKKCIFFYGKLGHLCRRRDNLKFCLQYLKKNKFEVLYMRFHFWDRYSVNLIKVAHDIGTKTIVEAHCYPYNTEKSISMKGMYFIDKVYSSKVNKYVDLVAAITDESVNVWGCKTVKIENGINEKDSHVRRVIVDETSINLVCVANEQRTHGVKRIIEGIKNYYETTGSREIRLWLIGEYMDATKALISKYALQDHIILCGKKKGKELYEYYNKAMLGVGPLAAYLGNYHQGMCLKTKEYFSVGLPFITAASSDAAVKGLPEVLVVEEDDSAININQVINFIENLKIDQKLADEMHVYAVKNYSWKKEFDKIEDVLNKEISNEN